MNGYQDLFDEAIGTPPPPTVDVDKVIARQRRRTRWFTCRKVRLLAGVARQVV